MSGQPMGPDRYDADELMLRLGEVQVRARQIMREFNIASDNISVMARRAELSISDTALRAEFLRLLIDLHEFGREARSRGLLGRTASGPDRPKAAAAVDRSPGTRLFASSDAASDAVSAEASQALFDFLDR